MENRRLQLRHRLQRPTRRRPKPSQDLHRQNHIASSRSKEREPSQFLKPLEAPKTNPKIQSPRPRRGIPNLERKNFNSTDIFLSAYPLIMNTKFLFSFLVATTFANAQICTQRDQQLPISVQEPHLTESSGLVYSKRFADRLYHINDSGSAPEFFITDGSAQNSRRVPISLGFFLDTEDISVGPCLGEASCLVIGDVGDNKRFRPSIQFYFFKESNLSNRNLDSLAAQGFDLMPDLVLSVAYPDRPHNAEGFFLDNKGNLNILTKEKKGAIAQIFSLAANQITLPPCGVKDFPAPRRKKFKRVTKIDLKPLLPPSLVPINTEITGSAYNEKSQTIAVLTYDGFFEFTVQSLLTPSTTPLKTNVDYVFTPVHAGNQQEGIAYVPNSSDLVISSEMGNGHGLTPLLRLNCAN